MNNEEGISNRNAMLLSFVTGAALGAVVVALTTPKSGREVRENLADLGRRTKEKVGKIGEAWTSTRERSERAMADLKRDMHETANDLRN